MSDDTGTTKVLDEPRPTLVGDELRDVAAVLRARYPECPATEIDALVTGVYADLSAGATVSAHLIPLTMNLSLRELRKRFGLNLR